MQFWIGISFGIAVTVLYSKILKVGLRVIGFEKTSCYVHEPLHGEFEDHVDTYFAGDVKFEDKHWRHDDDKLAKDLYDKERVLCWVMTSPQNLENKARAVRDTWAKRCNKMLFISSTTNNAFPTIGVNVPEGRDHLTGKTMQAFRLIYEKYIDEADWFMKADDDTYVILENLRYFLTSFKKTDPVYFGHHFKGIIKQGYYSGGGGYVLSKEALMRFGKSGKHVCRQDGGAEDVEMGKCMDKLGVRTVNTTDARGRSRFHCLTPQRHMFGDFPDWYWLLDANGAHRGTDIISDYAITFHYVPPEMMFTLDFYIYHLRPYGIVSGTQELNRKPKDQEINMQKMLYR